MKQIDTGFVVNGHTLSRVEYIAYLRGELASLDATRGRELFFGAKMDNRTRTALRQSIFMDCKRAGIDPKSIR